MSAKSKPSEEKDEPHVGSVLLPLKKRARKSPGVMQKCFKNHRLVYVYREYPEGGHKIAAEEACEQIQREVLRSIRSDLEKLVISVLAVTCKLLGGRMYREVTTRILPYLVHRVDERWGMPTEWLVDVADRHHYAVLWQRRYRAEPWYPQFIQKALEDAVYLNGILAAQDADWASCDEHCGECYFADECRYGECDCPASY